MAKPVRHYDKWRIRWIDEYGVRQSRAFDSKDEAELALQQAELYVKEVKYGITPKLAAKKTFNELVDYWITTKLPFKRSAKDDLSILKTHLMPAFSHLLLKDITPQIVDSFKLRKAKLNPKTLYNILTLLKAMLNKAVALRWLNHAPKVERPKISMYDQSFKFLTSNEEIERFLRAALEKSELHHLLYATAIYTGAREGEIAGLKWSDFNFDRRLITIRHSYEGPTKSGRPRHVPILDPILIPLKEWRLKNPLEWVFPNRYGLMLKPCSRIFQEDLKAILKSAGFPERITPKGKRGYIVFHDLRHTFASHWVMNGGDFFKLKEILGHKDYAVTQRYSHLSPNAFSADYQRLGNKIETTPSVLKLRR